MKRKPKPPTFFEMGIDGEKSVIAITERRVIWAAQRLIEAGNLGVTSYTRPAPRWSAYVHRLRHEHGGDYPGSHGRYFLRCSLTQISPPGVWFEYAPPPAEPEHSETDEAA